MSGSPSEDERRDRAWLHGYVCSTLRMPPDRGPSRARSPVSAPPRGGTDPLRGGRAVPPQTSPCPHHTGVVGLARGAYQVAATTCKGKVFWRGAGRSEERRVGKECRAR